MARVDAVALKSAWFLGLDNPGHIASPAQASAYFAGCADGAFVVCELAERSALSIYFVLHGNVSHQKLSSAPRGLSVIGIREYFPSLSELVAKYQSDGSVFSVTLQPAANPKSAGLSAPHSPELRRNSNPMPAWDCRTISRAAALLVLKDRDPGTFIVRSGNAGVGALSVVVDFKGTLFHQHLNETAGMLQLANSTHRFGTLEELLQFYAIHATSDVPILLKL